MLKKKNLGLSAKDSVKRPVEITMMDMDWVYREGGDAIDAFNAMQVVPDGDPWVLWWQYDFWKHLVNLNWQDFKPKSKFVNFWMLALLGVLMIAWLLRIMDTADLPDRQCK